MDLKSARKDLGAGAVFVGFGLAFASTASTYEVGSGLRMGPGYFPLVLGGLLVLLGLAIAAKAFISPETGELGPVPWRAAVLLVAAILFFGFAIRGLGVVPTLFVSVLLAALAGPKMRPLPALVIATVLTAMSVGIFIYALQLPLPLLGPWVG
ncbi:MAG: tripartite tricarboxylate transporter TctB family protein [Frankiaceae bacterium]|nr:tripartite tricarboxylate transporter TctB family protein [Frankiaceae bacterium]